MFEVTRRVAEIIYLRVGPGHDHHAIATEILAEVATEPRRLHAEDLRLILEHQKTMTQALDRLTAAVATIGTGIQALAVNLAAHPATQPGTTTTEDDSAELTDLAEKLEGFGSELSQIASEVGGTGNASGAAAGSSDTSSSTGESSPPAGADTGAAGDGSAGTTTGDAAGDATTEQQPTT